VNLFRKITFKFFSRLLLFVFICVNIIAAIHAYKFTHFSSKFISKTKSPEKLTFSEKISALFLGVNNPRPVNKHKPTQVYSTLVLQSNKKIECWYIKSNKSILSKGTIMIFHGYGGDKSTMLDKSDEFLKLGYNTFLVDFMGSGGSEGDQTTIGFKEAEEVKTAWEFLDKRGEKNIYLFGTSMGAVAILKALNDFNLNPKGIILECPFGSMKHTVGARFKKMSVPSFPMASLLVFWGGLENGFWAFGHNPTEYAKSVKVPTLLFYGEKDKSVSREEIDGIFNNLKGKKTLKTFELSGHENYLIKYNHSWVDSVSDFLDKN
jgi:uncharacterized protein